MATYYFVIAEDDMWWVKGRGKAHGGFLMRSHAVKQAIHSAGKCRAEAHVVVQEPNSRWRIEWSNQAASKQATSLVLTAADRLRPPRAAAGSRSVSRGHGPAANQ